jgi:hypothetical protein
MKILRSVKIQALLLSTERDVFIIEIFHFPSFRLYVVYPPFCKNLHHYFLKGNLIYICSIEITTITLLLVTTNIGTEKIPNCGSTTQGNTHTRYLRK